MSLFASGSLKARMLKAGGWGATEVVAKQSLRLAGNLIMTRMLMPEAFGIMAMVTTVHIALELFSDLGVSRSIQREPDGDKARFLHAAWVVQMLRGGLIGTLTLTAALLLWLTQGYWAAPGTVYAAPELPTLLAFSALVPLMKGAGSPVEFLAVRRLKLRWFTIVTVSAQALGLITMYAFAQISATVWALLAGMLAGAFYHFLATHLLFKGPRMRFVWDPEVNARLWKFGKWILGSSPLHFVASNGDRFVLGGFLCAATFGVYIIATLWIDGLRLIVRQVMGTVGFAGLSEVWRDRPDDLPRVFNKLQRIVDLLCIISFLGVFLFSQYLIDLLYSDVYSAAGGYMQILSLWFILQRFNPGVTMLMTTGDSFTNMVAAALRAAGICIFVPLASYLGGIEAILFAVALGQALAIPYIIYRTKALLGPQVVMTGGLWILILLGACGLVVLAL